MDIWDERQERMERHLNQISDLLKSLMEAVSRSTTPSPYDSSVTELEAGNNNATTAIGAALSGHDDKFVGAISTPAIASTSTPPHTHDPSPKSSPDSTCRVTVAGTDEYALVAATPEVATELAVLPGVSSSTTKAQEVLEVPHDASLDCAAKLPVTCSTDCSNQVVAHASVNEVRDAATAICLEPTINLNDKEVEQLTPARATSSIGTGASTDAIDVKLATPVPPIHLRCSTEYHVDDDDRVKPMLTQRHAVHFVVESKGLLLPPLRKKIKQQPWPPPFKYRLQRTLLFRSLAYLRLMTLAIFGGHLTISQG